MTPGLNENLLDIVPDDPNKPYDVKEVLIILLTKIHSLKLLNYLLQIL